MCAAHVCVCVWVCALNREKERRRRRGGVRGRRGGRGGVRRAFINFRFLSVKEKTFIIHRTLEIQL